jgi:WD40 repeat protein
VATGHERTRLPGHEGPVRSVAFSPDGKTLASGSDDHTVRLWDVATRQERARLDSHQDKVKSASDGGQTLASGSDDRTVQLWKAKSVVFSPDGKTLAIGLDDGTVRLWDVVTGKKESLPGHEGQVHSVTFSSDGKTLASGSDDRTVRLWDVVTKQELARLPGHEGQVRSVAFSPDGKTLASGSDDRTVRLWDLGTGKQRVRLQGHQNWVRSVALSPDGQTLASGLDDRTVRLWDLATGRERARLEGHQDPVLSVAFSPDGQMLASGSDDRTVQLWNLATGREHARLQGHWGGVYSVAFSPDGKTLASGSGDNTVRLWDVATGREHARLEGHRDSVRSVAFSPDGQMLVSGSDDRTVRLWDVATKQERARLQSHWGGVYSVAFSPDGKILASGSDDRTVRLWDLTTRREQIPLLEGHQGEVYSVAFSPDGKTLASGSGDNTVRLWDVATGSEQTRLEGHQDGVYSVVFSPDGQTLASGSHDDTVRVWTIATAKESALLALGSRGTWASCVAATGRCWRVDDGTLIADVDSTGRVQPLKPPGQHQDLEVALDTRTLLSVTAGDALKIPAGHVLEIPIKVSNQGTERAFWLKLIALGSGKNTPWALEPVEEFYLDLGKTATLTARVHLHTARTNPEPVDSEVRLAVSQAYGDPIQVSPIQARVETPMLQVREARWLREKNQQVLAIMIECTGQPLAKAAFRIQIPGLEREHELILTREDLVRAAVETRALSFDLPPDLKKPLWNLKVTLLGQKRPGPDGSGLPLYDWEFRDVSVVLPSLPWSTYLAEVLVLLLGLSATLYYYQRVYRHPAVVRLTAQPQAIRDLDLGELATARCCLNRAGRLKPVLQAARVHATWLEQAVAFDTLPEPRERCRVLAQRLGRDCDGPLDGEEARWTLDLGEDFPLNLRQLRLCLPAPGTPVQDVLNRLGIPAEVTLVLGADAEQRRELADLSRRREDLLLAPDGRELTALLLAEDPVNELAHLIARHVPVTQVSPYQTGAGVNKQSLFFGRGSLITQVMGRDPANYLVVGGRQVGKSSLLKELERRYRHDPRVECHYLVLSDQNAVSRLAEALGLAAGSDLDAVLNRLRKPRERCILLLIDEADAFVHHDQQQGYETLQRLRALSEECHAHFILAGFWELYQQAALDYQSPLKNFGEVLTVGALEWKACQALAMEPMARLNIRWDSEALVTRLIEQTGQRANLISLACQEVLEVLRREDRVIRAEHLEQALAGRVRDELMQGWGELSRDPAESRRDRIVVYATAPLRRFSLADLMVTLERYGYRPEPEDLRRSLARLELAFVLKREGSQYFYRVPLQCGLILADDTELLLRSELEGGIG